MPQEADRKFAAVIRLNGEEDADFYQCIRSITVTEDLDRGSSFQIELMLEREDDGSWRGLDEDRLWPWNRITILAAFPEQEDVVFDGYVSHVNPASSPQGNRENGGVTVRIRGVDASYVMNLEEKCRVWTGKTYEQIADEVIQSYGLRPVLPAAADGGDAEPPAVTQRATDRSFLLELARRKGYELFVHGGDAHFHPPRLDGEPQKLIAYAFGCESNCRSLAVEVNGTRPTRAAMTRLDPISGEVRTIAAEASDLTAMGRRDLSELRGFGAPQTTVVVRRQGAASEAQMTQYVQGLLRRNGWWIKATGTLDGLLYGAVLRTRRPVTIKGLGRTYNGSYYVRRVVHKLAPRGYEMDFEAVRNRLEQTGSEDFTGESPSAAPVPLPASASGGDPEVVRVQESGRQVRPA